MKPLILVIEKSQGELWGRVNYKDDLLVDTAKSLEGLERKIKKLLKDLYKLDTSVVVFEHHYDLAILFEKFSYLKITAIAKKADMNAALLRQYVTGIKHPSAAQARKVEMAIHKIGKELSKVTLHAA